MKGIAWSVFLTFIGISATANYLHGADRLGGALMAVVPVGFSAVIFLVETLIAKGRGSAPLFIAAAVVGGGAAIASYVGLYTMAIDHSVPKVVALLLPLAYDGVVVVASLAIRGLGNEHLNTEPVNTQMNTPEPVQMNTPMNTSEPVQMNTQPATVQVDVSAVQSADEHLNTSPVNTLVNTEMNTPVNTDLNTSMNTPEPVQMNTPKKPVNTPKAKPVNTSMNTDRGADLNTVRDALAAGKSVREIARETGWSVGKVSGLKKEIEHEGISATQELAGVDMDAELAKLLDQNDK